MSTASKRYKFVAISNGLHAYIVTGKSEAARERLAFRLAEEALCRGADAPCGECADCRKVEARAHPDLHEVSPDGAEIKVAQVREMRSAAQIKPNEAARQVFVVHLADKMNVSAQNALLATIEEPPTPCIFIFVCENERSLLQTVRSRCGVLRAEDEAEEALPEASTELVVALMGASHSAAEALEALAPLSKMKSEEAVRSLEGARAALVRAAARDVKNAESALKGAELAAKAQDMLRANVSATQVTAWLTAELVS